MFPVRCGSAHKDVASGIDSGKKGGRERGKEGGREGRRRKSLGTNAAATRSGSSELAHAIPPSWCSRDGYVMAGREVRGLELGVSTRGRRTGRTGVAFFSSARADRNFPRRSTDARGPFRCRFFFSLLFSPSFFFISLLCPLHVRGRDILFAMYAFSRFAFSLRRLFSSVARFASYPAVFDSARLDVLACVSRFSFSFPQVEDGVR